jgi:uncharacterized protein (DUF952 family)
MENKIIYHITTIKQWNKFTDIDYFEVPSLQLEGFIHASTAKQLNATANRYYKNESEIIVLTIDAEMVKDKLKYEFSNSVNEYFPHIYGVIEKKEILKIEIVKKPVHQLFQIIHE